MSCVPLPMFVFFVCTSCLLSTSAVPVTVMVLSVAAASGAGAGGVCAQLLTDAASISAPSGNAVDSRTIGRTVAGADATTDSEEEEGVRAARGRRERAIWPPEEPLFSATGGRLAGRTGCGSGLPMRTIRKYIDAAYTK